MTNDGKIKKLEQYRDDLAHIGMMFHESFGTSTMRYSDRQKYATLVLSIKDFLQKTFGENDYFAEKIKQIHNKSIELHNYDAPMVQDVESIVAVVDAAIERMKNCGGKSFIKSTTQNIAAEKTDTEIPHGNNKKSKSLINIAEMVVGGLLLACVIYLVWFYLGIKLNP